MRAKVPNHHVIKPLNDGVNNIIYPMNLVVLPIMNLKCVHNNFLSPLP